MKKTDTKLIAFYLPQYHPIRENNEWWGEGFTEWTNVSKARPNFEGHHQPQIPRDLGFYDLRRTETFREQAELAKAHGIHGFCFYWYWFNGKQLLEQPMYALLKDKSIRLPFCFCWANENWTRTWDGKDKEVLMKQEYSEEQLKNDFVEKLLPFFRDERYIKVDGKPLLLVYRSDIIPGLKDLLAAWRNRIRKEGFPGIHLACVYSFNNRDYSEYGYDAGVEFPPHQHFDPSDRINSEVKITNPRFHGNIYDYRGIVVDSLKRSHSRDKLVYRGLIPMWDNTARRQDKSHIYHDSSPKLFQYWLTNLLAEVQTKASKEFIFINAWNEWGEGCHLEPDQTYRREYLLSVQRAVNGEKASAEAESEILNYPATRIRRRGVVRRLKDQIKDRPLAYRLLLPVQNLINYLTDPP